MYIIIWNILDSGLNIVLNIKLVSNDYNATDNFAAESLILRYISSTALSPHRKPLLVD